MTSRPRLRYARAHARTRARACGGKRPARGPRRRFAGLENPDADAAEERLALPRPSDLPRGTGGAARLSAPLGCGHENRDNLGETLKCWREIAGSDGEMERDCGFGRWEGGVQVGVEGPRGGICRNGVGGSSSA